MVPIPYPIVRSALALWSHVPTDQNGTPIWTELRAILEDLAPSNRQDVFRRLITAACDESSKVHRELRREARDNG